MYEQWRRHIYTYIPIHHVWNHRTDLIKMCRCWRRFTLQIELNPSNIASATQIRFYGLKERLLEWSAAGLNDINCRYYIYYYIIFTLILNIIKSYARKRHFIPCGAQCRCCNDVMGCLPTLYQIRIQWLVDLNVFVTSKIMNACFVTDGLDLFTRLFRHSCVYNTRGMRL
jgi:hypothetical protein